MLFLIGVFGRLCASEPSIQYLFPVPGSSHVPAGTDILVRFQKISPSRIFNPDSFIEVAGEKSGAVSGEITVLKDEKTLRFLPHAPFQPGETVAVQIHPSFPGGSFQETVRFTIHDRPERIPDPVMQNNREIRQPVFDRSEKGLTAEDPRILNGVSVPSDFPLLHIAFSDHPADGRIFINHGWDSPIKCHMMFDNTGAPMWYHYTDTWFPMNFSLQDNGEIAMSESHAHSFGDGYITMDNTYTVTDSFWINWNGYVQNDHEFVLLEDGRWFMLGEKEYDVDLSQYIPGAQTNVTVRESAIFGYPAGSRSPNFIWRAFDHFDIADTDEPEFNELNTRFLRFPHMNALDIDTDGHLVLSSRHLSEITKINIETGDIIWRLGGNNNQFSFINDPLNGPSCQHNVQALGDHRYTVFDNGNLHDPPVSRGAEWRLDTTAMTATLVWEYRNTESLPNFSNYMGNNQRLPNGNRLINWAYSYDSYKLVTEVTPEGDKTLEFGFEDKSDVYRVTKHQWEAVAAVPYLVADVYADAVTLIFNKFGDTDVDYYNIYGGAQPNPETVIATSEQPFVHVSRSNLSRGHNYFRVTAVNHAGQESGFSNRVDVFDDSVDPGQNMVHNGDFENGFDHWEWWFVDADAAFEITEDHQLHLMIQDGGDAMWDIQLFNTGLSLINGKRYRFEFDARAEQNRAIFIDIEGAEYPYANYSQTGGTALTPNMSHFSYEFNMNASAEARIVLLAGGHDHDVYIDNVSLIQVETNDADPMISTPRENVLLQNYPNPFNASTKVLFDLAGDAHVTVEVVDVNGRSIRRLVHGPRSSGLHSVTWNGDTDMGAQAATGVYILRVHAKGNAFESRMSRKVLMVK